VADDEKPSGGTPVEQFADFAKARCQQCGAPAFYLIGPAPLCLECVYKIETIEAIKLQQHEMYERKVDYISDQLDATWGLGRTSARYRDQPRLPAPNIFQMSQPIFHNISIANSTVGAVNTGTDAKLAAAGKPPLKTP
jgi:hypothetical protein